MQKISLIIIIIMIFSGFLCGCTKDNDYYTVSITIDSFQIIYEPIYIVEFLKYYKPVEGFKFIKINITLISVDKQSPLSASYFKLHTTNRGVYDYFLAQPNSPDFIRVDANTSYWILFEIHDDVFPEQLVYSFDNIYGEANLIEIK